MSASSRDPPEIHWNLYFRESFCFFWEAICSRSYDARLVLSEKSYLRCLFSTEDTSAWVLLVLLVVEVLLVAGLAAVEEPPFADVDALVEGLEAGFVVELVEVF